MMAICMIYLVNINRPSRTGFQQVMGKNTQVAVMHPLKNKE